MAELFRFDEAAQLTGGRIIGNPPGGVFHSVAIDSRKVEAGGLFVALTGERCDGHDFIPGALEKGAGAILMAAGEFKKRESQLKALEGKAAFIEVEDPLLAMQQLAHCYIKRMSGALRVGITGSNGKTTTKEVIGAVLSEVDTTYVNEGNLNSDIGLPLSIFRVTPAHKFVVLEMGMNYEGEMDILSDIFRPQVGLITNIGRAHIGPLGSMDAIAAEKKKIFKFFDGNQKALIKEDEKYFSFLSSGVPGKIIPYGQGSTKGFEGYRSLGLNGMTIYWEEFQIHYPLIGLHNLSNALGAISLARELGVPGEAVKRGLEKVKPLFGRSEIIHGEWTIIQDCYNSNPDSVKSSLDFLNNLSWQGRKLAVLGSMFELGEKSVSAHREVALYAGKLGLNRLYLFGKEMEAACGHLREKYPEIHCFWTSDLTALVDAVKSELRKGDLLLLKGSRGIELERLAEQVK